MFLRRSTEEAQRMCTEDVEVWTLYDEDGQEPMYHGHDGIREWFARLDDLWAYIEILDAAYEESPGGWVLVRATARLRGRGSPHDFEAQVAVAIRMPDGLVDRFGLFADEAQARAMIAAG